MGDTYQEIAVDAEDRSSVGIAEVRRPLGDGVENGLRIARRARDSAQDLARGGLLLAGLGLTRTARSQLPLELGDPPPRIGTGFPARSGHPVVPLLAATIALCYR